MTTVLLLTTEGKAQQATGRAALSAAFGKATRGQVAEIEYLQREINKGFATKNYKQSCQALERRTVVAREMLTLLKVFPYRTELLPVDQHLSDNALDVIESAWEDDVKAVKACRKFGII